MHRNQNFEFLDEKLTFVFRLFDFWNFFSTFPFSPFLFFLLQWLAFYWACLWLKTSKKTSLRQAILSMEQPGVVAGNFALSFSLNFLSIFVHISGFGQSLWSGHHWKDLFLLQKLSIHVDDANFGQKWWRQKWKKGQGSSRAVMDGIGDNGLISSLAKTGRHHHHSLELFYTCNETVYLLNHSISCFQIA